MCRAFPIRAPRRTHRCLESKLTLVTSGRRCHLFSRKPALVVFPVGVHVVEKICLARSRDNRRYIGVGASRVAIGIIGAITVVWPWLC